MAVLPTHGPGSFCSAGPTDGSRTSTIGTERRMNPMLAAPDEAAFRAALLGGSARTRPTTTSMAPINRAGPPVLGRPAVPPQLDAAAFAAAVAAGAHVVDGRPRAEFAAGHLPGSTNIELTESFASYVGWFVPFGATVALVLPEPLGEALEEAAVQLFRIGYDRVAGGLAGGAGGVGRMPGARVEAYPTTTIEALHEDAIAGRNAYALDVRDPHEWREDGVVPGRDPDPARRPARPAGLDPARRAGHGVLPVRDGGRGSPRACSMRPGWTCGSIAQGGAADWPAAGHATEPAIPADPPR